MSEIHRHLFFDGEVQGEWRAEVQTSVRMERRRDEGNPLIVCGDIDDAPGLDASEKRLFGSGVERLVGAVWI